MKLDRRLWVALGCFWTLLALVGVVLRPSWVSAVVPTALGVVLGVAMTAVLLRAPGRLSPEVEREMVRLGIPPGARADLAVQIHLRPDGHLVVHSDFQASSKLPPQRAAHVLRQIADDVAEYDPTRGSGDL